MKKEKGKKILNEEERVRRRRRGKVKGEKNRKRSRR